MVKPGYKQTEIGVIPEDWDVVSLNSLSIGGMQNGVFYEVDRKGSGVSFLNVGDLYGDTPIRSSTLQKFNATLNEIERFRINSGDLFFTRSSIVPSGIAYCNWYYGSDEEVTVFDSHIVRFKTNLNKVVPMYLYLQCISPSSRKYFIANSKTATMTTIDQTVLGDCQIAFPLMKEQEKIAQTISDIDCLIANLDKLLAKKKAIKQGAMQELLTGKRRLPGFDGEWVELEIGANGRLLRESIDPQTHPNVMFSEYSMPACDDGQMAVKKYGADMHSNRTVIYGTVLLFNKLNVRQKRIWLVNAMENNAVCSSEFLPYCSETIDLRLLQQLLSTEKVTNDFIGMSTGTSNSQKRITPKNFLDYIVYVPNDINEQAAIADILVDMDSEIAQLQQTLVKYQLVKQGMMSELLTGRIRLIDKEG